MPTDNMTLPLTVEEVNDSYIPGYNPIFSLLTRTEQYSEEIGFISFQETNAIGDLRAVDINAQDTEIKQIAAGKTSKVFNKYFKGNQYTESGLQRAADITRIAAQVLDVQMKQFDQDVFYGDPVGGTIRNNGLWVSVDPNYDTLAAVSGAASDLNSLKTIVDIAIQESDRKSGNTDKVVLIFGALVNKINQFVPNTTVTIRTAIEQAYQGRVILVDAPAGLTLNNETGLLVLNTQAITLKYLRFPSLHNQGYEQKTLKSWFNFLFGSASVDIHVKGAIVKQEIAFA